MGQWTNDPTILKFIRLLHVLQRYFMKEQGPILLCNVRELSGHLTLQELLLVSLEIGLRDLVDDDRNSMISHLTACLSTVQFGSVFEERAKFETTLVTQDLDIFGRESLPVLAHNKDGAHIVLPVHGCPSHILTRLASWFVAGT